jgi:translation initiation factor 4G
MTSVSQQNQPPTTASNTTSTAQPSQSYASATKKAVSLPINATTTSNSSAAVAVSNAAPVQQNAKSSSISPVNGRPAVMPAVPSVNTPAVAHGSYATNGSTADHSRKGSVTISANGGHMPNGGPVGGQKAGIQFGSITDSPAVVHSTPQIAQSASTPISIPGGNPRVISPAHSPSPIPQPAASGGGRPPSTIQSNGISFGSLGGDGDVSGHSFFFLSHILTHIASHATTICQPTRIVCKPEPASPGQT